MWEVEGSWGSPQGRAGVGARAYSTRAMEERPAALRAEAARICLLKTLKRLHTGGSAAGAAAQLLRLPSQRGGRLGRRWGRRALARHA